MSLVNEVAIAHALSFIMKKGGVSPQCSVPIVRNVKFQPKNPCWPRYLIASSASRSLFSSSCSTSFS